MTRKQKKMLYRILVGAAVFLLGYVVPLDGYFRLILFLPAYFIVGGDVLIRAVKNILKGQAFDENFLMTVATIGAFAIGEYPEGVAVMLFYQIGELFQNYAVHRSRTSIANLMDIRPDYANLQKDGELVRVDPEEIAVGDIIVVKPGEKIPLDGIVIEGSSMVDTSALTGESVPRQLEKDDMALSGCINQNGVLNIQVTKEFGESTASKILELVENASSKKAQTENFITKFARYYTPIVVLSAIVLAILPPLLIPGAQFSEWLQRALIFLVISCPCALVISVPLSFFSGIGGASKCGILVKGSNYLEALAEAKIIVFDKTGTLTKGTFQVTEVNAKDRTKEELLEIAALAESYSDHPISLSLKKAYGKPIDNQRISEPEEISGHGVKVFVDNQLVLAGNDKLMQEFGIVYEEQTADGSIVYVSIDNNFAGYIVISDEIKEGSELAIRELKDRYGCKTVMLTGDRKAVGESVAKKLGIDEVYTELLPVDKLQKVEQLLSEKAPKDKLVFAGDGINDTPVLTRSDIGIAMGGLGSDAAIEAADIVIMDDRPEKVVVAIEVAKKIIRIVKENIVFALGVKILVLILGAMGIANMWEAVFADVGVSVLAILNSFRALNVRDIEKGLR